MSKTEVSALNEDLIRSVIVKATTPLVFKGFVRNWPLCKWDVGKWCSEFGEKEIPFRCMVKQNVSNKPCWERLCWVRKLTFKRFVDSLLNNEEWMYFDYKYLHQWFGAESELCKNFSWKQFGYADKGPRESTLWVGSSGAHTPCHQDTYGANIVAQLHGKKRWILFPPESGGMKPTRVPYEESSVYSELNFYCPSNLKAFGGVSGGRVVELCAGDALLVPRGWWHYVQNMDALNISLNIWLPHEKDSSAQVSEALTRIFVAQICKDLPQETIKLIVNPNEDDLSDTPLAVLFLQLETVAKTYLDIQRKARGAKRQKTSQHDEATTTTASEEIDLKTLLGNKANNLEEAESLTNEKLVDIIKENLRVYANADQTSARDAVDGTTSKFDLTKALIDSFCQGDVIELVKQNIFARMS